MTAREKLFAYNNIYDQEGSNDLFCEAMKESIQHHSSHCQLYQRFLEAKRFYVECIKSVDDCKKIPAIPAHFFKYHEVLSINKDDIEVHATSSGTEGQKSQIFLDSDSIKLGTKMAIKAMKYHGLISLIPTNYLMLGYEPKEGNEMGNTKVAMGMTRFAPAKEKVFALRAMGDRYEVDYFGIINALKRFNKQKLPVRIMGFPSYLYMLLKMMKDSGIKPLRLNKRSLVLTGGGWKKFDDIMIDKKELYQMVEEFLGIPSKNCRDFYSAVEHSVAYPECENHHMHVPIWSRVIIRDVKSLEPLGFNQPGFLSFISPLVSSMPISSIVMGDMAVLKDGKDCGCGIVTPYFEIIGRMGTSKARSCAVAASEYMKGE
ncbi:LuxE/PaaK family acyltransferase [Alkaliphilus peptidifermentans]|uniref:Acyl-protein synthetase, LuxE n=1 Tax=Alkaliphilus peptidifermentans DSM 18978 TaxID=1120976 RepID=A0A1G5FZ40_9FIRM|nr:acyl-protein synthetase [Alkaliphilus peptidifermentans]SCY44474.1 Acyl-protein synthetase, LuxE [Alkaliphilus peptidifermentans DSM 18978]